MARVSPASPPRRPRQHVPVAERQHLVITSWQLRYLGLTSSAVTARVRRGGWSRPFPGVLVLPGPDTSLRRHAAGLLALARPTRAAARVQDLVERGATMDDALVSAAMGCGVALGARSSAWLQQLLPTAPPLVSVRVPPGQNRVARSGVDLRRRESLAIHIVKGLPVLTPFATLTDCAAAGGDPSSLHHELARMAAAGDALRSLPLDDFLTATGRLGRQPGSAVLRAAHCGWTSRSTDRITCCRHSRSATGGAIDWSARRSGTWSGSQPPWWTNDLRGFERQVAGVVDALLRQQRRAA